MGQIVAALDLGTSKSIAIVARKDYSGKLSILNTETIFSKNAMRRGRVYNLDEIVDIISKLIRKLNSDPDLQIKKMYVGIGGQSLRTQSFVVEKTVVGGSITTQLLDSLKEEAINYKPEFDENLDVCSCEYYVDGQWVSNPKGIAASTIEARFLLAVGNPCLKRDLGNALAGKDISVAGYFITPLATAEAVLTPEEKESGCALIEWGDGVTYISIYKDTDLKYMTTLPLGGLAITKDIRSLNVSEEEADLLKIKHGKAISESTDIEAVPVNEEQNSSRKIVLKDLNWIIESRVDEIVSNIWNQIQASGYSQALDAGIVITGGGALLRALPLFIHNQTGKEVRLAQTKVWENQVETLLSPANSCVVGLAIMGKENCAKEKEIVKVIPTPTPHPPRGERPTPTTTQRPSKDKSKGPLRKLFEIGMDIFKDEDFNNPIETPPEKEAVMKDIDFENNTNKQ